jgi:molybdopterin synthase catalytic subunit
MITVSVCYEDFDVGAELAPLEALGGGAVASFTGIVRGGADFESMTLDHYPAMTKAALDTLATEAKTRWRLSGITIIHRIGTLRAGDRIVLVACASDHRAAALEACAFLIDRLKTDAPFWKKERRSDGQETWVDARESDHAAAARWG